MRNLAQRSASAALEIKGLINESVNQVEVGALLVDRAGVTMSDIVSSISMVTEIMHDISSAGKEQEQGTIQINLAITEMDSFTQQNAALVEQSAIAAESLQNHAAFLKQVTDLFKAG